MPSITRFYSSTAGAMHLLAPITAASTAITVDTVVGLPASVPFVLILDPGLTTEEIVDVTNVSGSILTITRGVDGSLAQAHNNGSEVRHGITARDLRDSRGHEAATAAHGTAGAIVGTTDPQTLTNKSIDGASNSLTNIPSAAVAGLDGHVAATAAHGATGAVVGTTNTQTLTNKTMSGSSNTFSNIPTSAVTNLDTHINGSTNVHGLAVGVAVVGTSTSQTLTNKTISGLNNAITNIPQSALPTNVMFAGGGGQATNGANDGAISNTSYSVGANSPTLNITVPPSGALRVTLTCNVYVGGSASTYGAGIFCPSLTGGGGSGIVGDNGFQGTLRGPGQTSGTVVSDQIITGLTPGGTVSIRVATKTEAGGNGIYFNGRSIVAVPV